MISNETVLFEDSPLTEKPGTILGYRENGQPIYNVAGGAKDVVIAGDDSDDDDDADTDTVDDSDDSDDDDVEDTWTPPSREDYVKLLEAKKKADSEAAARKRFLRDNGFDPKTGKPIEKPSVELEDEDDDDSTDLSTSKDDKSKGFNKEKYVAQFERQLEREVTKAERTGRVSAYALIHEVPSALEEAGWNGKNLARMTRLLELDDLEIDSDGIDADGLAAKVDSLKKDFPEFFRRTRMKDAVKEVADTGTVGGGKKQAPASEEDLDWKARMKLQLQRGNN